MANKMHPVEVHVDQTEFSGKMLTDIAEGIGKLELSAEKSGTTFSLEGVPIEEAVAPLRFALQSAVKSSLAIKLAQNTENQPE